MIYEIWVIIFLIICTFTDVKEQKVYVTVCLANLIPAATVQIFLKRNGMYQMIFVLLIAAILAAVSKITKEAIGMGDVLVLATIGEITDLETVLQISMWGFGLCMIWGIAGLLTRRLKGKSSVPLVPFVLAGAVIVIMIQEWI